MNTYSDEKFAYHIALFKNANRNIQYRILKEDETVFHAVKPNQKRFYYELKDVYATQLEKAFPDNQYALIYRGLTTYDTWSLYIKNGRNEFRWHISLHDEKRRLVTEAMTFADAKKADIPHVDESLSCFLNMMREMKEYRLYFLTGTVKEG